MLRTFLIGQLRSPSGWIGQLLLHLLNRDNATMNDLVLQQLAVRSRDRVLEIGFGGGYLLRQLLHTEEVAFLAGVEKSAAALQMGRRQFRRSVRRGTLELHLADATDLPFPGDRFDRVCTVNTIYFWADPLAIFQECSRVLEPNGCLVVGYNAKSFLEANQFPQHGCAVYDVEEVEALFRATGFGEILTVSSTSGSNGQFFCTRGIAGNRAF